MRTVTVKASKNYDVIIGSELRSQIGNYIATLVQTESIAIISDTNVWPLYGGDVERSLKEAGFSVCSFVFPAGEKSKNGDTYLKILNFLAENHITRTDILVALGGGVVGDITGFAAATYLRGISYIQVPTTLLSMVDSSVGGKTAIDLPTGKNLVGAFHQPSLVLCDISTLNTLPESIFRDGCAEVIKYAILYDHELFSHLENHTLDFDREYVISRCVTLKRDVVADDEFDRGGRQRLNLGHTIGHGVEASSNFTISHGQAVSIGLAIVTKAATKFEICTSDTYGSILNILTAFGLPIDTDTNSQTLYQCALSDKKRSGSSVNLIIPECIGCCRIQKTPIDQLLSFIEAGL